MLGRYISIPLLLVAAIIQSTVVPEIRIAGGGPDLVLMMVLSWVMLAGLPEGLYWAIVGGLLQDVINGVPTGTTALCLVLVSTLSDVVLGPVDKSNLILPPLVLAAGTVIYHLLLGLILAAFGRGLPISAFPYLLTNITFPTMMFDVVLILPIFRIMAIFYTRTRPRRVTL